MPSRVPLGKVGSDLTEQQGYEAARLTALSILGSLKRALGDLDRIRHWVRVFGMVNSAPGFVRQPSVINGFSDLILELFGPEVGAHVRSAVGMAELPFGNRWKSKARWKSWQETADRDANELWKAAARAAPCGSG